MSTPINPNWPSLFMEKLDHAINFHYLLKDDPHNIQNAVICSLTETRDALRWALKGQSTLTPSIAKPGEKEAK